MPFLNATKPELHNPDRFRYLAYSPLECNFSPEGIEKTFEIMKDPSKKYRGNILESGKRDRHNSPNDIGFILDPAKLSLCDFVLIDSVTSSTIFKGNQDIAVTGVFYRDNNDDSRFRATLLSKKIYEMTQQDPILLGLPIKPDIKIGTPSFFSGDNYEIFKQIAREEYGDNHWWESDDPVEIAKNQIFERCLLADFEKFHKGLKIILGRDVYIHELGLNPEGIQDEVRMGLRRLEKGIGTSDEYKQEAFRRSMKQLADYCKKTGKTLIGMETNPDRDENGIDISGYDGWLT